MILFGPEMFSKAAMVVEFFPLFLMQEPFFLHQVCLQDSYIRNNSPPSSQVLRNEMDGSLLLNYCMNVCLPVKFTLKA